MDQKQINYFLTKLAKDFFLFAPQKNGRSLKVAEVKDIQAIDWSGDTPDNTWKSIFNPQTERLFSFEKNGLTEDKSNNPAVACVGMNVLDLKALTLIEQVFSEDVYYQKRRRRTLIIGFSANWPNVYGAYKVFSHSYKEDVLEHLVFDVFLVKMKNGKFRVYSGSEKGQEILEADKITQYTHVEFAGPISEKGPDKKMELLRKKMAKAAKRRIWDELDKICIACGKCSIVCPTCFCFDVSDKSDPENSGRQRKWGNCFYNDFSLMAGGHKPLDTVKRKIYFWYFHKFVRIPHEYNLPGCVSCGRCAKVCPVGIKINEVLKKL